VAKRKVASLPSGASLCAFGQTLQVSLSAHHLFYYIRLLRSQAVPLCHLRIARVNLPYTLLPKAGVDLLQVVPDKLLFLIRNSAPVRFTRMFWACVINPCTPLPRSAPCAPAAPSAVLFLLRRKSVLQHRCHILTLGEVIKVRHGHNKATYHSPTLR
jgi:hypothetical protein